jgi:hypothetical protein
MKETSFLFSFILKKTAFFGISAAVILRLKEVKI